MTKCYALATLHEQLFGSAKQGKLSLVLFGGYPRSLEASTQGSAFAERFDKRPVVSHIGAHWSLVRPQPPFRKESQCLAP